MRSKPKRSLNLLLVVSIVGAILGMEIDVISGPLVSDSFSLVLCDLYTPDCPDQDSAPSAQLPAITIELLSNGAAPQNADESGESSTGYCETFWASPLIVQQGRQKQWPAAWIKPAAVHGMLFIPTPPPTTRNASPSPSSSAASLARQLCRLLC